MLKRLRKRLKRNEKGQGMVEYGLILALVSVVALGALSGIGGSVSDSYDSVIDGLREPSEEEVLIKDGFIPIASAAELNNLRKGEIQEFGIGTEYEGNYLSGLDKKYFQVTDISVGNLEPIGTDKNEFTGIFDGRGYTLNNLRINKRGVDHIGLFGKINGAMLKNVKVENADIAGGRFVGILVGQQMNSKVINSSSSGKVFGNYRVGGLVGMQSANSIVEDSHSSANLTSATIINPSGVVIYGCNIGGLVGDNYDSLVKKSYATGNISGPRDMIGGLVGYSSGGTIDYSHATGNVTSGDKFAGGLVGYYGHGASLTNSYASGDVRGFSDVGGLAGHDTGNSTTRKTYATGNVHATDSNYPIAGGLIGSVYRNSTLEDSYATGRVTTNTTRGNFGGFIGSKNLYSKISNSGWANNVNPDLDGFGVIYEEINEIKNVVNVVGQSKQEIDEIIKTLID